MLKVNAGLSRIGAPGRLPLLPLEPPREIAVDAAEIAEELHLLGTDAIDNAVPARVRGRPLRDKGKRMLVDTELPSPTPSSLEPAQPRSPRKIAIDAAEWPSRARASGRMRATKRP